MFAFWNEIRKRLGTAGLIALFLDFDGTLTELRPRPEQVHLPKPVRQVLARLAKHSQIAVVVISGRRLADVRKRAEGQAVLTDVREAAGNDPDIHILDLPPWSVLETNAPQRASTIIVQKSLREGFGLTVAEGLWKKKPVVASAVGESPHR